MYQIKAHKQREKRAFPQNPQENTIFAVDIVENSWKYNNNVE